VIKIHRRLILLLTSVLLMSILSFSQGFNSFQKTTFSAVGTATPIHQSSIIGFHQLQWQVAGTVATCTVAIDSSTDGTTWVAGGILTGQTCTSAGQSTITAASANFIRVNVTALSGAGAQVQVSYLGWINNPQGSGAGTVTNVQNLTGFANSTNSTANVGWSFVSAPASTVWGRCTASLGAPSYCSITAAMLPDLSATYAKKAVGSPADGCATWASGLLDTTGIACGSGGGGSGTVTSMTSGSLLPIFDTNVATQSTTPALTFSLRTVSPNLVFGNCTGSLGNPAYCSITSAMLPNLSSIYQPLLGFTPENTANKGTTYPSLNVNGHVPPSQLGTGLANSTTCLTGAESYVPCGGSTAAPSGSQGQMVMLNGTGQFQVISGLGWDPNTNTFTIPGILDILGSWYITSDIPSVAMAIAPNSQSAIGFDSDGKIKVSENNGAVTELAKLNSNITGTATLATNIAGTPLTAQYYGTNPTGGGTTKGFYNLPAGGGGGGDISSAPVGDQTIVQPSTSNFKVNRFETKRFCDQYASLQACHDDLPANGGEMIVPQGTTTACAVTITKDNVHLIGQGDETSVLSCSTAASPVLRWSGTHGYVENVTIQHATNQPTCAGGAGTATCGDGLQFISTSDRHTVRHVKFKNNYNGMYLNSVSLGKVFDTLSERNVNHGFLFDISDNTMQWNFITVHAMQNGGDGFHMQNPINSNQATCGQYENITAFGNNGYGFFFQTTGTSSGIGDCKIVNAILSTNNNDGMFGDFGPGGGARSQQFTQIFSEQNGTSAFTGLAYGTTISPGTGVASNVGYGMNFVSCDSTPPPQVNGGVMWNNAFSGIYAGCARMSINGVSSHGNGRAASANDYQRSGITIRADGVSVIGGEHDGDTACSAATCQKYAVEISNSADFPTVSNPTCHTTLTGCVQPTTQPAAGFLSRAGNTTVIYDTGAPAGACVNGNEYHRTDAGNFDTLFGCKNAVWVAMTAAAASGTVTNTGGSLTNNQLVSGAGTNDVKVNNLSGAVSTSGSMVTTLANGAVAAANMAGQLTRRTCTFNFGANNAASALVDADLGPQNRSCYIPYAATIVEMIVTADAGTPSIIVGVNHAGSISNIVSSALATAASGGLACSRPTAVVGFDTVTTCSATLQNTSIAAGDWLQPVSGTASTAKGMTVVTTFTVQ
jgi:hypothetical protein